MGKAAAFVCVIALGIVLIVSGDAGIKSSRSNGETDGQKIKNSEKDDKLDENSSTDDTLFEIVKTDVSGDRLSRYANSNTSVCTSPPDIEGAITPEIEGTQHPPGTEVSYSCPLGYVSRNSINHISICKIDRITGRAEWTVPEITCSPRPCGDPGNVNNGRRIGNLFTFPNKVEYECEEGYKLRGLSSRYCQAGGEWSGRLPTCNQISCNIPEDPANGRVTYSSLEYGTELKYECNVGFVLREHQPRICSENGSWSNEEPKCIEATCEEPQPPKHGTVKLLGEIKVGSLATYSCDPDRRLHGATTTKCLITGKWTFEAPECLSSCIVPFIENGEMGRYQTVRRRWKDYEEFKKVLAGNDVNSGETLTFRCKSGSLPVDNSEFLQSNRLEVTCNDGMWSKDLECKRSSCIVPFIENGEMGRYQTSVWKNYEEFKKVSAGNDVNSGEKLIFRCKSGSLPVENSEFLQSNRLEVTCSDGMWSKDLECKRTSCNGQPPATKNGSPIISREHGKTIYYTCPNKSYVKIKGNVTCHFGSWIGIPPKCLLNPCYTRDLNYPGLIKPSKEHFDSLESFPVNCEKGYEKTPGMQNIACARGRWEISQNPCRHDKEDRINTIRTTTETFKTSQGGEIQTSINTESSSPQTFDAKLNRDCFCTLEYLENSVKAKIGYTHLKTGDTINDGETVTLGCWTDGRLLKWRNGFQFLGKVNMTCSTCGKWKKDDLPTCARSTGDAFIMKDTNDNGNLEILPGGIIDVPMRKNMRFVCMNSQTYPYWDFKGRKSVTSQHYVYTEGKNVFYASVLDITQAADKHSGEYECFSYDASHNREGSIFLHLEVKDGEDGSISTPDLRVTSPSGPSVVESNNDCFCVYEYEDQNLNAQTGQKIIKLGDTIKRGETVSFECKHPGTVINWKNGLRLTGKVNMTCTTCKNWQEKDVPYCTIFRSMDTIISYDKELNLLPGGIASLQKGVRHRFSCTSSWNQPEWNYPRRNGVSVKKTYAPLNTGVVYLSHLDIEKEADQFGGEYECYLNDNQGQRRGSNFLHLQVNDYVSCPEFPTSPDLQVNYTNGVSVGSIATFRCLDKTKYLAGTNFSECQENRSWSNPLPSCEDQKCSIFRLSQSIPENVVPDTSNETEENVTFGSVVKLKCGESGVLTGDSEAQCMEGGKWKLGNFQCVPGCYLNLDPSSHLVVQPKEDSYRVGDSVFLSCPPGEEMSSKTEVIMCLSNRWSDSFPECTEVKEKKTATENDQR